MRAIPELCIIQTTLNDAFKRLQECVAHADNNDFVSAANQIGKLGALCGQVPQIADLVQKQLWEEHQRTKNDNS